MSNFLWMIANLQESSWLQARMFCKFWRVTKEIYSHCLLFFFKLIFARSLVMLYCSTFFAISLDWSLYPVNTYWCNIKPTFQYIWNVGLMLWHVSEFFWIEKSNFWIWFNNLHLPLLKYIKCELSQMFRNYWAVTSDWKMTLFWH